MERAILFVIVKNAQHVAERRINKSPFVVMPNLNWKPVEIRVIPTKAINPARAFLRVTFSLRIRIARIAVKITDVLERTEALEDVVNLCPKNWNIKPRVFKIPSNAIEPFFRIENFLSVKIIIRTVKKEAKANLINKRSRGLENLREYLIIGKEVLHKKEDIRIKIIFSILMVDYIKSKK